MTKSGYFYAMRTGIPPKCERAFETSVYVLISDQYVLDTLHTLSSSCFSTIPLLADGQSPAWLARRGSMTPLLTSLIMALSGGLTKIM